MIYIGPPLDRLVTGLYRVRLDLATEDGWDQVQTEAADRDDILALIRVAGSGVRMAGGRVIRARLVGPVNPGGR